MERYTEEAGDNPEDLEALDEPEDGWFVYCLRHGERYEACRPYYVNGRASDGCGGWVPADDLRDGLRLYLNFGQQAGLVFVRRGNQQRPEYACWRSNDAQKGPWRTLRFCAGCPDPEVCGYLDRACRLAKDGNPRRAFRPKAVEPAAGDTGFGLADYVTALQRGQIWLNHPGTVYALLHDLHARCWRIFCARQAGRIYKSEALFRQTLEERWTTAIFCGRNPLYAVTAWNTDLAQLAQHIRMDYYIGEQCAEPEDAPPPEQAIAGIINCIAVTPEYAMDCLLTHYKEGMPLAEALQLAMQAMEDDARYHTRILLGLSEEVAQQLPALPSYQELSIHLAGEPMLPDR